MTSAKRKSRPLVKTVQVRTRLQFALYEDLHELSEMRQETAQRFICRAIAREVKRIRRCLTQRHPYS